jgi:hypothetical protein
LLDVKETTAGPVFAGGVERGWVAWVDADWVRPAGRGQTPALLAGPDGSIRWGEVKRAPDSADPDDNAARALAAVARAAAAAVNGTSLVQVRGDGALASLVRSMLPSERPDGPQAIVEATGRPEAILSATRELADLGTLVLAGPTGAEPLTIDLYPDVHVRGLALVGVPSPLEADGNAVLAEDVALLRTRLANVRLGDSIPPEAGWFRIEP